MITPSDAEAEPITVDVTPAGRAEVRCANRFKLFLLSDIQRVSSARLLACTARGGPGGAMDAFALAVRRVCAVLLIRCAVALWRCGAAALRRCGAAALRRCG